MSSLSDIPVELLDAIARDRFIQWLSSQPIDDSAKRRVVRLWTDFTEQKWTKEQYAQLGLDQNGTTISET